MMSMLLYAGTIIFFLLAIGAVAYEFVVPSGTANRKRLAVVLGNESAGSSRRIAVEGNLQRRKNVQALLKELERQQRARKQRPTLRRQIEQAGLGISVRTYWIASGIAGLVAGALCLAMGQPFYVIAAAAFGAGMGLPRWTIAILRTRRQKKFTEEFANAIDIIVRSVRSGIPTNEALKVVAREIPEPVSGEFSRLVESMKVGVTLEQGLKRMHESMPTAEVSFFGIVMTIQQKSGGNLSEALNNLAGVLRDRKRLQQKIRAMSSEAKASAGIIGSLPPAVMVLIYLTSPDYIKLLFTERMGNLMLAGCVLWMGCGIAVMKKMISFKH